MKGILAQKEEILKLIPQRPPVVMIDQLLEADEKHALTTFTIREESVFSYEGCFREPGLIENIAQTAAAMNGYNALIKNEAVRVGFIGAIKNLMIYKIPPIGTELETSVSIQNHVMNVTILKGEVKAGDELLVECEMKIFLEDKEP